MDETPETAAASNAWPSIDTVPPSEEGGPIARAGFNYQDEIAVGFMIEMLANPAMAKIHFETHDDIVLVWEGSAQRTAEYVQVKASEDDKFWSVPDICQRKKSKAGTSIFEKSLCRDRHQEDSLFRLVTLRPVVILLRPLTYARQSHARQSAATEIAAILQAINERCPEFKSAKGRDASFWAENCFWDCRDSERAVATDNLVRLVRLAYAEGKPILLDPAEVLLLELRAKAKDAGSAKWLPDPAKKVVTREALRAWWEGRVTEIVDGASTASGGKLAAKMAEAGLQDEMAAMGAALRRGYASEVRTPRYLETADAGQLQKRVMSEIASLRARFIAGQLGTDPATFHSLCLSRMDEVNAERGQGVPDQSAFLKGCLYDITDRCLLRFTRPSP